MHTKVIFRLPTDDAGCDAIKIFADTKTLVVTVFQYEGREEHPLLRIEFLRMIAVRFVDEMRAFDFIEESYDAIVEIEESLWLKQLKDQEPAGLFFSAKNCRHFACFFSNNGYLEVICEDIKIHSAGKK